MVTCVGKTSEPHVIAMLPSRSAPSTGTLSVSDLVGENGIGFQNMFPARPTILEPIEVQQPTPQQQQQQQHQQQEHSPMETHQNNLDNKGSVFENNLKNLRSASFCDEEAGFEFPIIRNRSSSDHRSNDLSPKLSEYRINESIADDNSLPPGMPPSALQDEDSVSSPSSGFQQRLNFSGMINPAGGFSHCVESPMGVFGAQDTPVYSLPIAGQAFQTCKFLITDTRFTVLCG